MFAVRHQKAHPKAQFSNKINQPDRIGRRRRRRRAHTHQPEHFLVDPPHFPLEEPVAFSCRATKRTR